MEIFFKIALKSKKKTTNKDLTNKRKRETLRKEFLSFIFQTKRIDCVYQFLVNRKYGLKRFAQEFVLSFQIFFSKNYE